jgi:putative ABC transport system permease protein
MEPIIFNPLSLVLYSSIRLSGKDVDQTIAQIRDTWSKVFPDSPFEYFFLNESFNDQYKADQQFGKIFGLFTMLAIFISCLGLFGLSSFTLMQRTKEIGVRKVLGASILDIMLLSYREFSQYIILANVIALPIAWYGMGKWLQNFAYRISLGGRIFILAGALSLIIAFLTVSFQAVKSALADPVKTLRYE